MVIPFKELSTRIIGAALTCILLMSSGAIGEDDKEARLIFDCTLSSATGKTIQASVNINADDQVQFKINGQALDASFIPNPVNHSPTIAFAASFLSNVFTLVVHRDIFQPHPEGYDPNVPPATLTIQYADERVMPAVDVYLGECLIK